MAAKKALNKEPVLNLQQPFSFNQAQFPKRKLPVNFKRRELPVNIKGLCVGCGYWFQKLPKPIPAKAKTMNKKSAAAATEALYRTLVAGAANAANVGSTGSSVQPPTPATPPPVSTCPKCYSKVVELPEILRPWQLLPPNTRATELVTPFSCIKCREGYYSYSVFGASCGHKSHTWPTCVCRFCCIKRRSAEAETEASIAAENVVQALQDPDRVDDFGFEAGGPEILHRFVVNAAPLRWADIDPRVGRQVVGRQVRENILWDGPALRRPGQRRG